MKSILPMAAAAALLAGAAPDVVHAQSTSLSASDTSATCAHTIAWTSGNASSRNGAIDRVMASSPAACYTAPSTDASATSNKTADNGLRSASGNDAATSAPSGDASANVAGTSSAPATTDAPAPSPQNQSSMNEAGTLTPQSTAPSTDAPQAQ